MVFHVRHLLILIFKEQGKLTLEGGTRGQNMMCSLLCSQFWCCRLCALPSSLLFWDSNVKGILQGGSPCGPVLTSHIGLDRKRAERTHCADSSPLAATSLVASGSLRTFGKMPSHFPRAPCLWDHRCIAYRDERAKRLPYGFEVIKTWAWVPP